ncbi:mycothione reductase [Kribbella voronezhensis]|uniref:Mycothione reductase n=1 Tax=Kribbella voronezhensis TaxID=2512212 RepID=A0A4R7TFS9_9ACTN|nr:mycothione reductase [Kribbella voronezhensis]TDU91101.1 mycothione reductase [Kribbella voronezhensis]
MTHYDLVVVGTGSGNTIVTKQFADRKVAIVERGVFGGTCLNVGCIPTKMFVHTADLAAVPSHSSRLGVDETLTGVRWPDIRDRIFGRIDPISAGGAEYREHHPNNANVTLYHGTGRFTAKRELTVTANGSRDTAVLTADRFVLAAGSRPIVPFIPGLEETGFHTSETIMRLDELPRRLGIIGSGFVAAESAHIFSSLGVDVTLIARSDRLLRHEDSEIAQRYTEIAQELYTVKLLHETVHVWRRHDGIVVKTLHPDGAEEFVFDELLIAVGRTPNSDVLNVEATGVKLESDGRVVVDEFQETAVEGIYALGDLCSPYQLKHVANHEARVVQHNLLHPDDRIESDHRFVPHAVFGSPQVAAVGLTEEQAIEQGVRYVVGREAYADIAYGWAMEDTTGFAKILADPDTGQILGCHVIGPQAATVIQPVIQAMSFGLDAHPMARGQYWIHPAMPELIENALLALKLN